MEFQSKLSSAREAGNKSDIWPSETENIMKLYKSQKNVIIFNNDDFKMIYKLI